MYNQIISGQNTGTLVDLGPATTVNGFRLKIGALNLFNNNAVVGWLQIFKKPASGVTLGTTAPDVSIPLTASGELTWSFGDKGWNLGGTGLSVAATTTRTGAVAGSIAYNIVHE